MTTSFKCTLFICTVLVGSVFYSCRKLTEVNINPNESATAHPQALLPKVEWDAFRSGHGTAPLYALKMLVQTDGENANQIYNWQRGSFDTYDFLRDIEKMIEEADKRSLPSYTALAKFFRAYHFYNLTLTFGDIPYSEATKGEKGAIYIPKYDSQKEVFVGILKELEEASSLLLKSTDIIEGDIIYKGSRSSWRKLINSFRLKVLLTLSNKDGDFPLDSKAEFLKIYTNEALVTNVNGDDDGKLFFLNQDGNRYPEFNASNYGSGMYMDSTFIRRLQDHKDPRLFVIATQTRVGKEAGKALNDFTSYEGGDPIVPYNEVNDKAVSGKLSKVHDRFHQDAINEPYVLLGCAELKFILAEAIVKGWISGNAKEAYTDGIKASFKFYQAYARDLSSFVNDDQFISYIGQDLVNLDNVATNEEKLQRILMQKYLRSFHQGGYSAYFDHLRTGFPTLRKSANVKVAYRWMYPQDEYNNNKKQVADAIQKQFNGNDNINLKTWWLQ